MDYLTKKVFLNRMWKYPLNATPRQIRISPVRRCYSQETQTRQIPADYGLSFSKYFSVNDGVDSASSSLSYVSIDHLLSLILSLGRGAMLVKADMKEPYRMIPIHPQDQ